MDKTTSCTSQLIIIHDSIMLCNTLKSYSMVICVIMTHREHDHYKSLCGLKIFPSLATLCLSGQHICRLVSKIPLAYKSCFLGDGNCGVVGTEVQYKLSRVLFLRANGAYRYMRILLVPTLNYYVQISVASSTVLALYLTCVFTKCVIYQ